MNSSSATDEHERALMQLDRTLFDADLRAQMSPLFFHYLGWKVNTSEGIRFEFNTNAFVFNYLKMKDKSVLDIGCGSGLRLISFALLGAGACTGIDISPEMIGDFKTLSDRFAQDVKAICGDFLDFEIPEESFDIVVMNDSISHVRDTHSCLVKIRKILAPGGCLWICDANNGSFLPTKIQTRRWWRRSESGPLDRIDSEMATAGRQVDRLPFYEARINIIQSAYPYLDKEVVRKLAKYTQGMYGEAIVQAVEIYITEGEKPNKPSFPYRNPYTGEFPELLFSPIKLADELRKLGFQSRVVPPAIYPGGLVATGRPSTARFVTTNQRFVTTYRRLASISPTFAPFLYPAFAIVAKKLS